MAKPIVAIVGRPNVGKSTLFNVLANERISIVEDIPGVTRDRLYATTEWLDREFVIIDTGGIEIANTDKIAVSIREQAQIAIREADVILFVCDARTGITDEDAEVAKLLRKSRKPIVLAVNKADSFKQEMEIFEFYNLGLGEPIPISAANHLGLGDMLDSVMDKVQQTVPQLNEEDEDEIKVALIGRPNVGKSSIFNALVGEERSIVSDQAGTTRDAIDTPVVKEGQRFLFIDTAGMRRKGKIEELIEKYSIVRSLRAVDRSDVVLMVIDAVEGVTEQDKKIVGYAHEAGKGVILVVNKWDLYKKDTGSTLRYTEELRKELVFLQYAPVVFVSAVTMQRIHRLPEVIKYVAEQNAMRISTSVINQIIEDACAINPPPTDKGRQLKIYFVTQVKIKPPTFVLFVNNPEIMHFSYQRYLENKLREAFGFEGTPIQMIIRAKNEEDL
ncbi:MAG: ribosome biogenesis GTPase Der [Acidaminococcaceae bacterium]|jgi:GTP-binding protein|uniref:GTPase Der n=1 Tax=Succiniclasticum ruminis TaxID=40841 RepID=A0A1G6P2R1_9FIRM|nr:ribosome biogenesis GTPase Der [Succiniclasticum ruminis]MBQ2140131.1 ribosome biogenesis GTPase Der [Acidaminococcaceae bacterium]MDY6243087.1 ribosome biogenesis GTPase Der [Lachnospiraceae bacterium]MBQ2220302.1 ribosome biogenesis GTPase Der [Acidaminococcaceae bacterium]MBQ2343757.1 ribosome biogenesis GTPase Der [Acidaminococcaceae bacterium]MBQ6424549.1 ribosome biogenesis GTPase Der [Acidaminococcaceae bacterium]